jgi:hypothetical protein
LSEDKGSSADGPASPVVPIFETVELCAIVQESLQRLASVRGALIEQGAEVTDTSDHILGRWRVERFEPAASSTNSGAPKKGDLWPGLAKASVCIKM